MLASPIGIVGGYVLTYYMNLKLSWEGSFIIQAIALVPCFVFLIIVPERYLNIELTLKNRELIQKRIVKDSLAELDRSPASIKKKND